MNTIKRITYCLLFCTFTTVYAEGEPLVVGTESYNPPFVQQGGKQSIFGFDIDMMLTLCKIMNRTCVFKVMKFTDILPAVETNKIDVATDSITITAARSHEVSFSLPYLPSNSRFLTTVANSKTPFSFDSLKGKSLGIQSGTIFVDQVSELGIKNANIKLYDRLEDMLDALNRGRIDYLLIDDPTAVFWAANSAGTFVAVGQPLVYGFGYGIAVNLNNKPLLDTINKALLQYQNSEDFKRNYFKYLPQ
jgi:polar amino acid transport system substrate-binding protein